MTTKIVINTNCCVFQLSTFALGWLMAKGINGRELAEWEFGNVPRHNKLLVELVEELGGAVNADDCLNIEVIEVETPSGRYCVYDNDGREWVITPESTDWVTV